MQVTIRMQLPNGAAFEATAEHPGEVGLIAAAYDELSGHAVGGGAPGHEESIRQIAEHSKRLMALTGTRAE